MRRRLRTPRALPTPMRIDFHAHILPHADHGCDGVPTARRQLDLMRAAGIGAAVAVAHFYPHRHTAAVFLRRRDNGMNLLHSALREGDPRILAGAEVLLCAGLEHMEGLERLSIAGSGGVLLLELPYQGMTEELWETIGEIEARGLRPVLAHLDRYDAAVRRRAAASGLPVQINAAAFQPLLRRPFWKHFCGAENVCALGSDLHGAEPADYRRFSAALQALGADGERMMSKTAALLGLEDMK